MKDDGGPAFPSGQYVEGYREDGTTVFARLHGGMSLRDWFAGIAMAGMHAGADGFSAFCPATFARTAYKQADAMIEARKSK